MLIHAHRCSKSSFKSSDVLYWTRTQLSSALTLDWDPPLFYFLRWFVRPLCCHLLPTTSLRVTSHGGRHLGPWLMTLFTMEPSQLSTVLAPAVAWWSPFFLLVSWKSACYIKPVLAVIAMFLVTVTWPTTCWWSECSSAAYTGRGNATLSLWSRTDSQAASNYCNL